ncbi:MAG: alkH [Haloplasmataceae bacterium]|jgi:aldehyde dehydrogenase (NAD+)|nr:alkH [Haloplasmataceae bacterium]
MDIAYVLKLQNDYFETHETKSLNFRMNQLKLLKKAIQEYETEILLALKMDLNKSKSEAFLTEIGLIYDEINYFLKKLPKWSKVKKVRTPFVHFIAKSYIVSEPFGQALIMAPWNYPFQLAISPLIGAIAGGNTVIIKPSEYAPHTTDVIDKMISETFDVKYIKVIQGGLEINKQILEQKFDYIFFTGSASVGKIVMQAAAKNLTPVTLELGGKSPAIVTKDANIKLAAKRIIYGKLINTGQTCVAPDYILVDQAVKYQLVTHLVNFIKKFYGDDILNNDLYPRIINEKHFERILKYLDQKEIIYGGKSNQETLKIEPTLIDQRKLDDSIMQEEIFGPVLPIIEYTDLKEAIKIIKERQKPLALYLFTDNKQIEKTIINNVSFGGGCINDTIVHLATKNLPFGGAGESGMGAYHGKATYDTFTHKKSILKKSNLVDFELRYPPFGDRKYKVFKKFFK